MNSQSLSTRSSLRLYSERNQQLAQIHRLEDQLLSDAQRINDLEEQNARLVSENDRLWALVRAKAPAPAQRKRRRTSFEMHVEQTDRFRWWSKSN